MKPIKLSPKTPKKSFFVKNIRTDKLDAANKIRKRLGLKWNEFLEMLFDRAR